MHRYLKAEKPGVYPINCAENDRAQGFLQRHIRAWCKKTCGLNSLPNITFAAATLSK
jgi:hypothetical protein